MNEHDEYEQGGAQSEEPITERVRIIGAETAGTLAAEQPPEEPELPPAIPQALARSEHYLGFPVEPLPDPPAVAGLTQPSDSEAPSGSLFSDDLSETPELDAEPLPEPELPHWTDPPTGQVPAVIDRRPEAADDEDSAWAALVDSGPVWREHQHEWDDSGFDPSVLADDETRVGVLEESPVAERRPWEFDNVVPQVRAVDEPLAPHDEPTTMMRAVGSPLMEEPTDTDADSDSGAGAPTTPSISAGGDLTGGAAAAGVAAANSASSPRPARRRVAPPSSPSGDRRGRNIPVAVATGVAIAAVALGCLAAGTVATMVLATIVVVLAAAECYASLRRAGLRPATLLGLVATVALMVSAYTKGTAALPLIFVIMLVTTMAWYLVGAEKGSALDGISSTLLGFMWISLLGSFAALMLAPSIYPARHGIAFLLGAIVATVGADVGALAVGSWLGRHQLAPHVSPNKTWEGLVGGGVLAVAMSAAITGQMHPFTPVKAAVLGLVVALVAPLGDLCESVFKRDLGLKDMGTLLPGHGGVLDRVDGLLFVLPATFYLVRVLHLG